VNLQRAAPQLVEGSRLTRHDHRLLSCASGASSRSLPFQRFRQQLVHEAEQTVKTVLRLVSARRV